MKKYLMYIAITLTFLCFGGFKVSAADYNGNLGYDYSSASTNFYFYIENPKVTSVEIHIDSLEPQTLIKDDSGIWYVSFDNNQIDLKGKEYYYKVCYTDTPCVDMIDVFANYINTDGNKNVIIDSNSTAIENWETLVTSKINDNEKIIYAIEADKFVENISPTNPELSNQDSIFEKLILDHNQSNIDVGYSYLKSLGIKYLEIGNLYDSNNYFAPNQEYSSKIDNYSSILELKNMIKTYKNNKINIVLRTNFVIPGEDLNQTLSQLSSNYIVDGKINLNDSMMQRYIEDVYTRWVSEYKIDGFYIEDANLYPKEYLDSLINKLKVINPNIFIYTNSKDSFDYYTTNNLQEILMGTLLNQQNEGILNGNYNEEIFTNLVNAMFSGYYSDLSKYNEASKVINTLGSFEGLDVYSKFMLISGLGTKESVILNKVKMAFYTLLSSTGIPRIIAGNEFLNTKTIPSSEIDTTPQENMECNNSKTLCYAKGDYKTIDWAYLVKNSSELNKMILYRSKYSYQYPGRTAMVYSNGISYDANSAKKGVLYLNISYDAQYEGDIQKSIYIINYSDTFVNLSKISDRGYTSVTPLLGRIGEEDGNTIIYEYTVFTFSETKVKKFANWVYVIIAVGLVLAIFGIRAALIRLLKVKRGIDYTEYSKEQKIKRKESKKKKVKQPSIFETYLSDEPIFSKLKRKKKSNKEQVITNTDDKNEDIVENETLSEDNSASSTEENEKK